MSAVKVVPESRMDLELKAQWVAALRSGEYKQYRTFLKSARGYCCLGVLREVADAQDTASVVGVLLTTTQRMRYGLSVDAAYHLARMNDEQGKTFPEIAAWIEANL